MTESIATIAKGNVGPMTTGPAKIGDYQLVALLGSGGMGDVYFGVSPTADPVAVKVIRPHLVTGHMVRERFASARRGAHEHDYVETADYAEAFLHEVMRLTRTAAAKAGASTPSAGAKAAPAAKMREGDQPVVIRTSRVMRSPQSGTRPRAVRRPWRQPPS